MNILSRRLQAAWPALALAASILVFAPLDSQAGGRIVGWGDDSFDQAAAPGGNDYVAIAAGGTHSLALKADGSIVCWGDDSSGQSTPPLGNDYVAIAAGGRYSLALKSDGSIVGWGENGYGQIDVPSGNGHVAIAAGTDNGLALRWFVINSVVLGGNGSVSPARQIVSSGQSAAVTITPDAGYHVESTLDNGALQTIATPYVISNVREDHYVVVTFAPGCVQPSISSQPPSQSIGYGQKATLSAVAGGTPPFAYQWYEGVYPSGGAIAGATNTFYVTPALSSDTSYWVRITNDCGNTHSDTATVTVDCIAPAISTNPASQTISSGASASLLVVADGAVPMSYQWYEGVRGDTSRPMAGATGPVYSTPALTSSTSYWAQATNACGSANSATAMITVRTGGCVSPGITVQPQARTILNGQSATLVVVATGDGPMSCQWYEGVSGDTGHPVGDAVNPFYDTPPLTASALYWVRVSNVCGSIDSATATITVTSSTGPHIDRVKSRKGRPGDLATLVGTGFTAPKTRIRVYFGDHAARVREASATSLSVKIPRQLRSEQSVGVFAIVNGVFSNIVRITIR